MYERELALITESSQKEIEQLKIQNDAFRLKEHDQQMSQQISYEIDVNHTKKQKALLM